MLCENDLRKAFAEVVLFFHAELLDYIPLQRLKVWVCFVFVNLRPHNIYYAESTTRIAQIPFTT